MHTHTHKKKQLNWKHEITDHRAWIDFHQQYMNTQKGRLDVGRTDNKHYWICMYKTEFVPPVTRRPNCWAYKRSGRLPYTAHKLTGPDVTINKSETRRATVLACWMVHAYMRSFMSSFILAPESPAMFNTWCQIKMQRQANSRMRHLEIISRAQMFRINLLSFKESGRKTDTYYKSTWLDIPEDINFI
jgi:hypothetical protein